MAVNSHINVLDDQIRECFGRVAWTHKTHEKCADILNSRLNIIKNCQIVLSAFITTGILVSVFGDNKTAGIISASLSFLLTILNTYFKKYDLGGTAQKHADAAISLWDIRESYLSLITDLQSENIDLEKIKARRDLLQKELLDIYRGSPRTISKAYKKASLALKEQEELTLSYKEINKFLPTSLHK